MYRLGFNCKNGLQNIPLFHGKNFPLPLDSIEKDVPNFQMILFRYDTSDN